MRKQNCKSDEMKERSERRETRGQRANRDGFSWRDGKRLPRLQNMKQRPGQEQEQRGEEIRGKGKEGERTKKKEGIKEAGEKDEGGEKRSGVVRLRGTEKGCQGR